MAARKKTKSSSRPKPSKAKSVPTQTYVAPNFRPILNNQAIITILCLIFAYPIGVTLMFLWTRWPFWIKMIIAIPMTIFFILILLPILATIIILNKLSDNNSERNAPTTPPAIVQTASPSTTIMSVSPAPTVKYKN